MTRRRNAHSLLIIDDDERMRDSLRESLTRRGYLVTTCSDGPGGLTAYRDGEFDLILCDLRMPEMDGLEVCRRLQSMSCHTPVVVITAFGAVETAVEAMRLGAFDYITKPFRGEELQVVIEKGLQQSRLLRENHNLRSMVESHTGPARLIGDSDAMSAVYRLVERYAGTTSTVLIRGKSGTGKELIARAIHHRSERRTSPFVCVNCAALSAGLLESELFGHEKGAFTGADHRRQGRFELAEGGTLLLDEVSEIDPGLQAKLLRVLQEKSFERVGSSRSIRADVRVLATTNRNLEEEVRRGRFREDLFFRLNVLPIHLPPLRDRHGDLPLLLEHFLEKNRRRTGGGAKTLSPDAEQQLLDYHWPGNVRELENVIERAWLLTDGPVIPASALSGVPHLAEAAGNPGSSDAGRSSDGGEPETHGLTGLPLREVEKILIKKALRRHGGHQKRTASELGIGVRTLRTKIKTWGLDEERRREAVGVGAGSGRSETDSRTHGGP